MTVYVNNQCRRRGGEGFGPPKIISLTCEGVSNTITQLRFLGCVFLEYHLGIMAKFVLPNISDISGDRKTKLK